jgi:allophanate hydrolase subunit 2
LDALTAQAWRVSPTSNRIGLRLEGQPLRQHTTRDLASFGVFAGVIQVPPDGQPILLMADAQPTGGYPVVAVAIRADLHRAAQVLPGDALRFTWTTQEDAVAAWRDLRTVIQHPIEDDEGTRLAAAHS